MSCAFFDVCKGRVILQRTPCGDVAGGGDVADGGVGVLCMVVVDGQLILALLNRIYALERAMRR